MEYILRPVSNRAEFLYFSIKSEIQAREQIKNNDDFITLFAIDGNNENVNKLIDEYPFKKEIIHSKIHGIAPNIINALNFCMPKTDNYVVMIQDDICVHKFFFHLLNEDAHIFNEDIAYFLTFTHKNDFQFKSSISKVEANGDDYSSLGPIYAKNFYLTYLKKMCDEAQYVNINGMYRVKNVYDETFPQIQGTIGQDGLFVLCYREIYKNYKFPAYKVNCSRIWHIGITGTHFKQKIKNNYNSLNYEQKIKFLEPYIENGNLWDLNPSWKTKYNWVFKPQDEWFE